MDQMRENVSCSSDPLVLLPVNLGNPIKQFQGPMPWEDDGASANYTCRLCMKTFYNKKALQNHKNLQHDDEATGSDEEYQPKRVVQNDQNFNGLCGFKYIPLENNNDSQVTGRDGLVTRTFTKDCTYLIIKIEGDDVENDAVKRTRLDGVVKKTQMKPKPTIDLRGPFTCTVPSTQRPDLQCRRIFFNCCDYSVHYREEHTKRRKAALRCQVCEKRLDRDFYPTDSIAAQLAANQFTFSCRICSQTFLDSTDYDEHNRIVHAKTKPHECSICTKRFTQHGGLQQHMRMHTGVRPFVCTFCPKAFTQKAGLDQHLRIHTKEKPFKCVICSKCFSQSVHLRQHMRTHTNIQPFECYVCGRKFKQSSHLNFHMRSHASDSSMVVKDQIEFLNIANLQPVQDGETIYYAAEIATGPTQNLFSFQPQADIPEYVLSM
ncbi:unnamed protein product [Chrysodeixis includens]|uniref:C2H2-type domain-containing protein n=1 Tax=Chrysodeixis includens TaxID=689277 RepID=A0A9P0FRP5_CHRIL|nr:unnamed protein product [Chrysodeixis includens]